MPLARQLVTPAVGPLLVPRTREQILSNFYAQTDGDRTVPRRSEPSSRAALMGEQPNPWDRLLPQDATSHRGAKPPRRCVSLGEISLLSPRVAFIPLSDGPSIRNHRITKPDFRPCSSCSSLQSAPLYLFTLRE